MCLWARGVLSIVVPMRWECHECGHLHDEIPDRCAQCGTAPEIVRNVWRCPSCGQSDIDGTRTTCPGCGADKGKDAAVAVDTSDAARIEGEQGRKLASGPWLYCAFCKTQVPPVYTSGPKLGQRTENCPTCAGPLSESTEEAASEVVRATEAAQYRKQTTQARGGGDAPVDGKLPPTALPDPVVPPPDPPPRRRWPYVLLAIVLGLGWLICSPGRKVAYTVERRAWERSIEVETLGKRAGSDWEADLPSGAYSKVCADKFRKNVDVPIGTETYYEDEEDHDHCEDWDERTVQDEVEDGKRCVEQGYKTQGGVSVKTCLEWEKKYKTVTHKEKVCAKYRIRHVRKTRTKYRQEPRYEPFCTYEVDTTWKRTRTAQSRGEEEPPAWPPVGTLGGREREGKRQERYTLRLRDGGGKTEDFETKTQDEWSAHPPGSRVKAEVKLGVVVRLLDEK